MAEELAQEALLKLCQHWERVRTMDSPGGNAPAWVDANALLFACAGQARQSICSINADGTNLRQLTTGGVEWDYSAFRALAGLGGGAAYVQDSFEIPGFNITCRSASHAIMPPSPGCFGRSTSRPTTAASDMSWPYDFRPSTSSLKLWREYSISRSLRRSTYSLSTRSPRTPPGRS